MKRRELKRLRREQDEQPLRDALGLYRQLGIGQQVPGVTGASWLEDDEALCVDTIYEIGRFRSADVTYTKPGYFAFGSPAFVLGAALVNVAARSAAKSAAQRAAAAQWRFYGRHSCLLTTRRVLFNLDGRWEGDRISEVRDIQPHLAQHALDVFYGQEPIRLVGPAAPWQAVAMLYLKYGNAGLHHPGLQPLAQA